jgi:hypothetical protein
VLERETRLLEHLKHMSLLDDNKKTVYMGPVAWLLKNGNIPRRNELNMEKNSSIFEG